MAERSKLGKLSRVSIPLVLYEGTSLESQDQIRSISIQRKPVLHHSDQTARLYQMLEGILHDSTSRSNVMAKVLLTCYAGESLASLNQW